MPSDPPHGPNPPPANKPRRRPSGGVGGNWIWMVILLLLVGMFMTHSMSSSRRIEWGEFEQLLKEDNLKKITLVGNERIEGEVRNVEKVEPDELRKKLAGGKFTVQRLRGDDRSFIDELRTKARQGKFEF